MPLELDGFIIEDKYIRFTIGHDQTIHFSGRGLDGDGRKIYTTLSRLEKGKIVEVKAKSYYNFREGIYEIVEMNLPPREEIRKGRCTYRFSGELEPVY